MTVEPTVADLIQQLLSRQSVADGFFDTFAEMNIFGKRKIKFALSQTDM